MSVVLSLLRAIDRADGEALVMHVGEKPYVVTASGHAELASKALTIPAMTGMLEQLLPADSRQALDEFGAVEYYLPDTEGTPGTRYSIVAARGGDDIWIELRRKKEAEVVAAPTPEPAAPEPPAPEPAAEVTYELEVTPEPQRTVVEEPPPVVVEEPAMEAASDPIIMLVDESESGSQLESEPDSEAEPQPEAAPADDDRFQLMALDKHSAPELTVEYDEDDEEDEPAVPGAPAFDFSAAPEPAPPTSAVVVPIARMSVRLENQARQQPHLLMPPHGSPAQPNARVDALQRLLQIAATQGASALYVAAQATPSLRVDGEIRVLENETPLTEAQLESGLLALLHGKPPLGEIETCDVPEVGRLQCLSFRDHRGLGAMFRMLPARAISAEHIGLAPQIQALCTEPEGLVLVAGARASGKSTLVASLVDQMNRTRRDHIITVESQIQFVHENRSSFVSQREARDEDAFGAAVRAAMREAPDVIVIDQVYAADVARFALQAASNGHLVIAAVTASTTAAALGRFVEFFGDERAQARATLGEHLRGIVTQTLLRKTGGGRAAAREVLVNVPSVSSLIAAAQFDQLGAVLNGGRRIGMVPLNDALLGLVQTGALDMREAYRKSPDQNELVQLLNRAGLDTSFAERLA